MSFVPVITELWTLYSFGTLMITMRVFCRWKLVGFRNLKPDDFLVLLAWAIYTSITVLAHIFIMDIGGKHTSLLTHQQREMMPVSERPQWALGSKIFMAGQITYICILWILKLNMLFFYQRVVTGLWVEKFIKPAMGLLATTAVALVLLFGLSCRPFSKHWQVWPDPGRFCVPQNRLLFLTVLSLNLLSDIVIMLIPIPIIIPLKTTILRRIGLYILFGLGLFCMMAAILRIVFVFGLQRGDIAAMWTLREDFVSIFVGQAPMVRPLFGRKFWKGGYGPGTGSNPYGDRSNGMELDSQSATASKRLKLPSAGKKHDPYSITQAVSDSQEEIVRKSSESRKMVVTVQKTVDVESMHRQERVEEPRVERWV